MGWSSSGSGVGAQVEAGVSVVIKVLYEQVNDENWSKSWARHIWWNVLSEGKIINLLIDKKEWLLWWQKLMAFTNKNQKLLRELNLYKAKFMKI